MTPDVHTLTGPFVLNALPDDERRSFERHLADCQSCQAEVAELRETAAKLAGATSAEPPASLKAKVLAAARTTRQLPPLPDSPVPRSRAVSRRSLLTLAAAGVAVAGSGAVAIDQYRDAARVRRQNEQLAAVLAESDARTVHGTVTGGGQATVVRSVRRDAAVVLLRDLRKPPDGRTYQLWLMDQSQAARSIGLAEGGSSQTLVDGGVADKVAFGLTIEPAGGSRSPTLPTVTLVGLA